MTAITGNIGFSYPKKADFYSRAVMFFTKSQWSHCFIVANKYIEREVALEADLKVQLVDFEKEYMIKKDDEWILYNPTLASQENIERAAKETFLQFSGETYGFFQIPWFTFRAFLKWMGIGKTVHNWFPGGVICSELVLFYLQNLGREYTEAFKSLTINETSPEEIFSIIKNRPDLFSFAGRRET